VVQLILLDYLTEKFITTSFTVNVYVQPGPNAIRLSRFSRENLDKGTAPTIRCSFRKATQKRRRGGKDKMSVEDKRKISDISATGSGMKRKRGPENEDGDDEHDDFFASDDEDEVSIRPEPLEIEPSDLDSDEEISGWNSITQADHRPRKKPRHKKASSKTVRSVDKEVLVVSSD
jgi:ATP-dependent DNA helicase Q1